MNVNVFLTISPLRISHTSHNIWKNDNDNNVTDSQYQECLMRTINREYCIQLAPRQKL